MSVGHLLISAITGLQICDADGMLQIWNRFGIVPQYIEMVKLNISLTGKYRDARN